ncbi:MAG: hypothetical protein H6Q68_3252 [Firmicutes bacterium]|nr:hypothetical protein [Bacillota bacterium]
MEINLIDLQKKLRNDGILISFCGRFSQEIIEELGDAVKKYLETESISQNDTYNVFSIFIEQTQNIKNYSASKSSSPIGGKIANSGIVTIGKSENGHFVSSGNIIESKDVDALTGKLDIVSSLDKIGLKKLYKEQMKKEVQIDSAGAGLGLIDMARKASGPLKYSLVKLDEEFHFFTLRVNI